LHENEFYVWCPRCQSPTYFAQWSLPPKYCICGEQFFDL
jgi:hypothetical protein